LLSKQNRDDIPQGHEIFERNVISGKVDFKRALVGFVWEINW
jgi:hypothetical protein